MGTCLSISNSTLLKKTKYDRKSVDHNQQENGKLSGRLAPLKLSRPIQVLKDPTGNDIFKRYRFGKELGRGEFGVTYQCFDDVNGESLACKKIPKSKLRTDIDIEDVRREVEIMRHLPKHPNIVSYREVYEDKEAIYLVMELCEGGELFDRIVARGHYTERAAAQVTKTILEVVKVCHEHGVIHRDLKPENFLYANDSENAPLKAIDFGLSIFFEPGQRFNEIVGSPYYMAPEVLRRNYGPEIDVWSTGVILYILLCGVPPFGQDFKRDSMAKNIVERCKDLVRGYAGTKSLQSPDSRRSPRWFAGNLPDEQVHGIRQMFHMMDTDKNGNLNFQELKDGLFMIGQQISDHDVQLLLDAADCDGNGMLNCEEFVTLAVHLKKISNDDLLHQAFLYFDKNQSGYIEFEDLAFVRRAIWSYQRPSFTRHYL
ncbi:UNVERIFIED_CONTAM: Calcium-dependent protein kinase [Sesamum calycinum]|uniref:non-specific serine/threonine protein kinase n=1 Tax=Sesamum calycinum TaxID=2727403 RepID=A0AAW2QLX7_9LAMI